MPKTAGKLHQMHFDTQTAKFEATFTPNADLEAPSRIYLNEELWYPHGYVITAIEAEKGTNVWSQFTVDTS